MNSENYQAFISMDKEKQKQFVKYLLGLEAFLDGHYKMIVIKKKTLDGELDGKRWNELDIYLSHKYALRFRKEYTSTSDYIIYDLVHQSLYEIKANEKRIVEYKIQEYSNSNIDDSTISMLLSICSKTELNNIVIDDLRKKMFEIFDIYKSRNELYHFVLGTGVSLDYKADTYTTKIGEEPIYGILDWESLENEFKTTFDSKMELDGFADKVIAYAYGVKYASFQIVKDFYPKDYEKLMYNLSQWRKQKDIIVHEKDTLNSIAKILLKQSKNINLLEQKVLTFNYDNILEYILSLKNDKLSIYSASKSNEVKPDEKHNNSIEIIHSHGFLPDTKVSLDNINDYIKDIVLTNDEYINAYKTINSYAYHQLYDFLNDTCCFIGNSITDYEEQKVISTIYSTSTSSFHFAFLSMPNGNKKEIDNLVLYKSFTLLSFGIIPLWFTNIGDLKEYLYQISENL